MSRAERDINKMEQLKKMGIDIGCGISFSKHPNMINPATGQTNIQSANNSNNSSTFCAGAVANLPGMAQYTRQPLIAHPPVISTAHIPSLMNTIVPIPESLVGTASAAVAGTNTSAALAAATAAAAAAAAKAAAAAACNDSAAPVDLNNFTSPLLVSARYTEQMQKRKMLWSHKKTATAVVESSSAADDANAAAANAAASAAAAATKPAAVVTLPITTNKWEMTKFSQDTDGKVASKFLRLMGMKDAPKVAAAAAAAATKATADGQPDVIQKQNEMFSTMEHQYEVARQVTHTMRGMGLGFGSQRPF